MKPKIKQFGFEVEAEMSERLERKLTDTKCRFGKMTSDGSIRSCRQQSVSYDKNHSPDSRLNCMEFVSKVLDYDRSGKITAGKIFTLLEKYRKEKEFHWNSSMGFHVHISFTPKMPVDCWNIEFANFFADQLRKKFKGVFKNRQNNRYCQVSSVREESIATSNYRYTFINFRASYVKHGTLEFRIFPSDKPLKLKRYLEFVFKQVNYFLANSDKFLNKSFEFSDDGELETEIEELVSNKLQEEEINEG